MLYWGNLNCKDERRAQVTLGIPDCAQSPWALLPLNSAEGAATKICCRLHSTEFFFSPRFVVPSE